MFGKPTLAINSTQLIMEPHKSNDVTLIKQFFQKGSRLCFDKYFERIGELQCVDSKWVGSEEIRDNSIDEILGAFILFARLNHISLHGKDLPVVETATVNAKRKIVDALQGGEFDHVYGVNKHDGAKFWRSRLEFNCAVDQKSFLLMRW